MKTDTIITVDNIYKVFGKGDARTEVLKGVNLSVEKGEFVSLMGQSGSGKSTLLYLIGGLDEDYEGDIVVCGSKLHGMKEKQMSDKEIDAFRIKCGSGKQWVNTLSGGNKQKVSFAKWTAKGSDVIIMDCPTRGVDIGVKQAMYSLIEEMKRQGKAILMISEELSELIGMSDRIIIMKDYKVTAEFERSADLKQTDMIEYMI